MKTTGDNAPDEGRPWTRQYGPFLTLGIQLAVTVVVCFFLGRWLDSLLATEPWLTIAGLVLGIAGGMVSFFRTAIAAGDREDREAAERRKHRDG